MNASILKLSIAAALTLAPTAALADGHGAFRRGGGHYHAADHGSVQVGPSRPTHYRHRGPAHYQPNFSVRVYPSYPRFHYRTRITFGSPYWHRGAWVYGWHGGTVGWWWGVNDVWYAYPAPVYPAPVAAPVAAPIEESPVNYWCASAGLYYPQTQTCAEEWTVVAAQPQSPPL